MALALCVLVGDEDQTGTQPWHFLVSGRLMPSSMHMVTPLTLGALGANNTTNYLPACMGMRWALINGIPTV